MPTLVYCVVINGLLCSNRIERNISKEIPNGIYSLDMDADDFLKTMTPADIFLAREYFRKSSKIKIVKGISFHDGIVPENPISYSSVPIKVVDATYDEFEEIEVVMVRNQPPYFLQILSSQKSYVLMDLKDYLMSKSIQSIKELKGLTPEMRIVYSCHLMERIKKEEIEPVNVIKSQMEESGANVISVKKTNRGYDVSWSWDGTSVVTTLDENFRVVHAGYCVSGFDETQSARSVVNLMKTYKDEGSYIHITRSPD